MKNTYLNIIAASVMLPLCTINAAVIGFEDVSFAGDHMPTPSTGSGSYVWNSGVAQFEMEYDHQNYGGTIYESWSGFKASAGTNTLTSGISNEYSAIPGGGSNSANYVVMYGNFTDAYYSPNINLEGNAFTTANYIIFGNGLEEDSVEIVSIDVANTTWAYNSMLYGDGLMDAFSEENDGVFLKVMIAAYTYGGSGYVDPIEFTIAEKINGNVIISDIWNTIDLSLLNPEDGSGIFGLEIWLETNLTNSWGYVNIPSYLALDNIVYNVIPEPAAYAAVFGIAVLAFAFIRRRKQ